MPKLNLQNVLFLGAAKPGSGSGGQIDYSRVVEKTTEMPTASELNYKTLYMYVGETDANYTHGYIYECQKTSITYTGTVSFEAATLSGTTVTCDGDDFATFLTEAGADPTPIVSGTMTYDAGAGGWRLVGKDADDETVTSFIEYTEDYTDHGFVFTGTPEDGDVIAFTCTVEEDTVLYAWVRLDVQPNAVTSVNGSTGAVTVQPTLVSGTNIKTINGTSVLGSGDLTVGGLPPQAGNAGKFLTTDGTDESWGEALINNRTTAQGLGDLSVGGQAITGGAGSSTLIGISAAKTSTFAHTLVAVGSSARATSSAVAVGPLARADGISSVAVGANANVAGMSAIQINASSNANTNNDNNTFKVANANGNFEIMSADGTIPADRFASTSGLADGNYRLRLTMASGVPTLSWVAE